MKLASKNIVMAVLGLSMLLLSNHGADATLRKPRRTAESIETISENKKKSTEVSLKRQALETIKSIPGDDYLTSFLESEECDFFIESLSDTAAGFVLDFDDDTIIEFACNAIQRKNIVDLGEKIGEDIAHHEKGSLTCKLAYEMKLSETMPKMIEATSSYEACKEEMSTELEIVHTQARRVLNAVSGLEVERELAICGGFCVFLIIVLVVAVTTPAY